MLMAEHLGVAWQDHTGEPLATRLINYVYELDEPACRDLTSLLMTVPQGVPLASSN